MKKEIRNALIGGLIGLILGWVAHIGFVSFDTYYNRPKLNFKIESLTVNETQPDNWEMRIILYQENTGNSEAIFNLNECYVNFPLLDSSAIKITNSKTYTLSARTFFTDTLTIPIPSFFENIVLDDFSSFHNISLSFNELRRGKAYSTSRDSTELELKGKLYLETENPPTVKDFMTINSKTGDSILIRGVHNFFYHDKFYTNHFLPSDATVKQTIKDDKIIIEFATKANKPFIYLPHEDLKDKIFLANTLVLSGTIRHDVVEGHEYKNFELTKKDEEGELYFFLFK